MAGERGDVDVVELVKAGALPDGEGGSHGAAGDEEAGGVELLGLLGELGDEVLHVLVVERVGGVALGAAVVGEDLGDLPEAAVQGLVGRVVDGLVLERLAADEDEAVLVGDVEPGVALLVGLGLAAVGGVAAAAVREVEDGLGTVGGARGRGVGHEAALLGAVADLVHLLLGAVGVAEQAAGDLELVLVDATLGEEVLDARPGVVRGHLAAVGDDLGGGADVLGLGARGGERERGGGGGGDEELHGAVARGGGGGGRGERVWGGDRKRDGNKKKSKLCTRKILWCVRARLPLPLPLLPRNQQQNRGE